ncbi:hypothetical protein OG21DRAFT_1490535, partial [Imleria badia]
MANPHLERCPDYMLPEFDGARLFFMVDGKTDQEAAAYLRNIWLFNHAKVVAAWDQQREAEAEVEWLLHEQAEGKEERQCACHEEEEEEAWKEERK